MLRNLTYTHRTGAPTVDTAAVNGDTLTLKYTRGLDPDNVPAPSDFTVTGSVSGVVSVNSVAWNGDTLTLTLASALVTADTVTLDYVVGSSPIRSISDINAAALTSQAVTNNTPSADPLAWVDSHLSGMASDEFKQLNTNTPNDVKLARTKANFDYDGTKWADDTAVATAIGSSIDYSFSAAGIDPLTGNILYSGGGHSNGGDSSIFMFKPGTSLAWVLTVKGTRYQNTRWQETATVTGVSLTNPCVVSVDDASAFAEQDQVEFSGVGGTVELNGNTYHIWAISGNDLTLRNIDAVWNAQATTLDATGFTAFTSGGTATVTPHPHGVATSTHYARTNADGQPMFSARHAYHVNTKGSGDDWWIGGESIFDSTGGPVPGRIYKFNENDTPPVTRWHHDARETGSYDNITYRGHMGDNRGPTAYNPADGYIYTWGATNNQFSFNLHRWTDNMRYRQLVASPGSEVPTSGAEAVIIDQPGDATKRLFFSHKQDSHASQEFVVCTNIEAAYSTPVASFRVYSGTFFNTGIGSGADARAWFKDDDDNIIYWGGTGVLGKVTTAADLDTWTAAQTGSGGTGDVPAEASGSFCAGATLPGKNAYLLCCNGKVWLYKI